MFWSHHITAEVTCWLNNWSHQMCAVLPENWRFKNRNSDYFLNKNIQSTYKRNRNFKLIHRIVRLTKFSWWNSWIITGLCLSHNRESQQIHFHLLKHSPRWLNNSGNLSSCHRPKFDDVDEPEAEDLGFWRNVLGLSVFQSFNWLHELVDKLTRWT